MTNNGLDMAARVVAAPQRRRAVSCVALVLLVVGASGCMETSDGEVGEGSPTLVELAGEPTCAGCEIAFDEVVVLGALSDPAAPLPDAAGFGCMVAPLADGTYALSGVVGGGSVFVYDSNGELVREIGRRGEGPGELGQINRLRAGPGDSLSVLDEANGRTHVFDPAGDFARMFLNPARFRSVALLDDGDLIFNREPSGADDSVFDRVDSEGNVRARIGRPMLEEPNLDLDSWIVAPRPGGGFWAAHRMIYEVHAWNRSGERDGGFQRIVPWFPPQREVSEQIYISEPPPAGIDYLYEDPEGRLWVYLRVPEPEWRPPDLGMQPDPEWFRRHFDNLVEVVDVARGEVVARGQFDGMLGGMCGTGTMYTVVETLEGDMRVHILRPRLIQAGEGA